MAKNGTAQQRLGKKGERVAIVAGLRTPFAKQWTAYRDTTAQELGKLAVAELMTRVGIDPNEVEQCVYGQVVPSVHAPNIAREIVLGTGLPRHIEAYSVSRACATSYQSTTSIVDAIATGTIACGIAGGADSASDVPITVSKRLQVALIEASKARSFQDRIKAFASLGLKDLAPVPPAIKEPSTGLTMGESAEKMAKENSISRQAQDELALRSHSLAAKAWGEGKFDDEVMEVYVPDRYEDAIRQDNLVREDGELAKYAKLKPVFDRKHGTITAANASPLTDGASALLLMREDKAKALGFDILGFVRSYAYAALDPAGQMLMGPSYATPKALDRAGITLKDLELVDMHEAFAAQVLSNTQAFESKQWAKDHLGRDEAIGEIDWDKFNVNGGSIAIGHPFAATGARQITQTLQELKRRGGGLGLCTACAAGGIGAAIVLEGAEA
ncbi:MAG: acetyl-CoA C-acyltransferase FadI [Deltaproteobacteria bacterium]|nr:acetyl-CoA C-acyltransferase FadI [Deltaproteobacteria bacterium]